MILIIIEVCLYQQHGLFTIDLGKVKHLSLDCLSQIGKWLVRPRFLAIERTVKVRWLPSEVCLGDRDLFLSSLLLIGLVSRLSIKFEVLLIWRLLLIFCLLFELAWVKGLLECLFLDQKLREFLIDPLKDELLVLQVVHVLHECFHVVFLVLVQLDSDLC